MYPWLLFLHVLSAMVWIGGGLILLLTGLRVRASADPRRAADFAGTLPYLALRSLAPAIVLLLLTGVGMVLSNAAWQFSQTWVLLALGLFVLAFAIGAVYLSRAGAALLRVAGGEAGDATSVTPFLNRWLLGYGAVLLILVVVVWDMIFKPGL
jgi:uncharacterized membrane protein